MTVRGGSNVYGLDEGQGAKMTFAKSDTGTDNRGAVKYFMFIGAVNSYFLTRRPCMHKEKTTPHSFPCRGVVSSRTSRKHIQENPECQAF